MIWHQHDFLQHRADNGDAEFRCWKCGKTKPNVMQSRKALVTNHIAGWEPPPPAEQVNAAIAQIEKSERWCRARQNVHRRYGS